jgi:hypothetical protein
MTTNIKDPLYPPEGKKADFLKKSNNIKNK